MSKQHSLLSPSASKRWINCSGSILLPTTGIPTNTKAADEGSLAHKMAQIKLEDDVWNTKEERLEECRNDPLYKPEMDDYVTGYVNYIESFNVPLRYIETVISLKEYSYDLFGTCDCYLIDPETPKVHVIDFKYGFGEISAENNTQLMLYGLGAANSFIRMFDYSGDFDVEMSIYQPRIKNTSTYTMKYSELDKWCKSEVVPAINKIHNHIVERNTGKWCKFCNKHVYCENYNEEMSKEPEFLEDIDMNNLPGEFTQLSDEKIVAYFEKLKQVESYLKELKAYIIGRLKDGNEMPGYKLSYPNIRSWEETDSLKQRANDYELYNLMTVAQAERKLGKDKFNELFGDYVKTVKGNPKLLKVRR